MTDQDVLRACYNYASLNSPDPSTQNGAVLVDKNGEPFPFATNRFPASIEVTPERLADRDTKLFFTTHAEAGAVFTAIRAKYRELYFSECTLYGTWIACDWCARCIIETGIRNVVSHKLTQDLTPDRWKKSIKAALDMLEEAGVNVRFYDGKIGGVRVRFDGQLIEP